MNASTTDFNDRMLSLGLARVSEAAAHASARLIGRGDEKAADQAAVNAMREQLNMLDIKGVVVIGEGEKDEAPMLFNGEEIGAGGPAVDIAVDPIDGTTLTSRVQNNAISVIAVAERGTMFDPGPCVYMDKIAVGAEAADYVDLDARYGLSEAFLDDLREHHLLYDRIGDGELLHAFTDPLAFGFHVEVLERRGGYDSYGSPATHVRLAMQRAGGS